MSLKVDDLQLDGGYKIEVCFENGRAWINILNPDDSYVARVDVSQPKGSDVTLRINDMAYPRPIVLVDTSDEFAQPVQTVAEVHRARELAKDAHAPYPYSVYHKLMADQAVILTKDNGDGTFTLFGGDQDVLLVPGTDTVRLWNHGA